MCCYFEIYFIITIGAPVGILVGQIWAITAWSGTNTVAVKLTKNAPVNLTTLPLHIYWVPNWPRVIRKWIQALCSTQCFACGSEDVTQYNTLYVITTNSQSVGNRECSSSFRSILRTHSSIEIFCLQHSKKTCVEPKQKYKYNANRNPRNCPYSHNLGAPQNKGP